LEVRLSPRELALLLRRAAVFEIPVADLVRDLALYGRVRLPPIPRANFAMFGQLGRIGNNLNQAVKAINRGALSPDLRPLLSETHALLVAIRRDLVNQP
jgi:hypothetical protein